MSRNSISVPLLEQTTTIEDVTYVKLHQHKPIFSDDHSFDPRFGSIWGSKTTGHAFTRTTDMYMNDETRQKELERAFFCLSLLGASLSIFGWLAITILLYFLDTQCDDYLNCILLDAPSLAKQCTNSQQRMRPTTENIILILLPSMIIFSAFLYAIVWQIFWKTCDNKLQVIHKKEMKIINIETLSQLETITHKKLSVIKKQTRKYQAWCILFFATLILMIVEWTISFVFDDFFVKNIIGRNIYRIIVLTFGTVLIKIVGAVTRFEYSLIIDDCNEFEIPHNIKQYWTQHKRNTLFRRQLIIIMLNLTLAIYFPAIDHYPPVFTTPDEVELSAFLEQLTRCAIQATFFIWGSILGSQLLAFLIEFTVSKLKKKFLNENELALMSPKTTKNTYNYNYNYNNKRTHLSTMKPINENSTELETLLENEAENATNSKKSKCVTMIVSILSKISVEKLYFLHENWVLVVVLHMFGLTFAWLNPSMLFLSGLSILLLAIIYKVRFIKLKPSVVYLYVPDLIFSETLFFILIILLPTIFFMLLPLWHYCWPISFGSVILGLFLTLILAIIRCLCSR